MKAIELGVILAMYASHSPLAEDSFFLHKYDHFKLVPCGVMDNVPFCVQPF